MQIINTLHGQKWGLVYQIAVETIKKKKVMVDVLTEKMTGIDEEIRAAKSNMLSLSPVYNNRSLRDAADASG